MAQIDFITYSGQLVTTVVAFTTLLWFVGTVVRSNTHRYVGFWNNVPALTSRVSKEYHAAVNTRTSLFSSIFGTLVSRMVDSLSSFRSVAVQSLAAYTYTGTWKNRVLAYINRYSRRSNKLSVAIEGLRNSPLNVKKVKLVRKVSGLAAVSTLKSVKVSKSGKDVKAVKDVKVAKVAKGKKK